MEGRPGSGQIGILGPVELLGDGPVPLGGVKERCLLAALAVHCGEAVSAASLVDALWADDPPRTATKTLQNYVLRVRRALAQAEAPPPSSPCRTVTACGLRRTPQTPAWRRA